MSSFFVDRKKCWVKCILVKCNLLRIFGGLIILAISIIASSVGNQIAATSNLPYDIIPEEQRELIDRMNSMNSCPPQGWFSCSVNVSHIKYYLCDLNPQKNCTTLTIGNKTTFDESSYDVTGDLKMFIHGWLRSGNLYIDGFRRAYSSTKGINLVIVDWGEYSKCEYLYTINYVVPLVGLSISTFINELAEYGADTESIHLIGYSVGAHIASNAANRLNYTVSRITGLDPAGPGYQGFYHLDRLEKEDADFVDIIHTNTIVSGISTSTGHIDFYPNGGRIQNGCSFYNIICHHNRSIAYFLESVKTKIGFYGLACDSYSSYLQNNCSKKTETLMGEYAQFNLEGEYYLDTNNGTPFSKGKHRNRTNN